jgi:hypothetical protein
MKPYIFNYLFVATMVVATTANSAHPYNLLLKKIANYTSFLDVGTNSLSNDTVHFDTNGGTDHIFVNANLARILLSTYRLQKKQQYENANRDYLDQGLAWCDTFSDLQDSIESSLGNSAGYWGAGYGGPANCKAPLRGDCAHGGEIYFGDTGTAVTTLALCYRLADRTRQGRYLKILNQFATFVLEGSKTTPYNKKGIVKSFVNFETGAVGCGYYMCSNRTKDACSQVKGPSNLKCPSRSPYTIATSTTGAAFFSQMYGITKNITYKTISENSMRYLSSVVLDQGEVPYILDGLNCSTINAGGCKGVGGPWVYDTISYVSEGVASMYINIANKNDELKNQWKLTVDYLLRTQNPEGYWGKLESGDLMRSPRCLTLLSWWLKVVNTQKYQDKPVEEAVERYLNYLINHGEHEYGLLHNTITTGMVGIALADAIEFGISF